ncbi:MAG: YggU family protein [Deltaproteobacteria bacterium]|nr:YggU family protein [Deltaproteobacteria bacterium]
MQSKSLPFIIQKEEGLYLKVFVQPRSSRNQIAGVHGDRLKITLTAPPVEDRANRALIEFLSKVFGIKKSAITIKHGETSRKKLVRLEGVPAETVITAMDKSAYI